MCVTYATPPAHTQTHIHRHKTQTLKTCSICCICHNIKFAPVYSECIHQSITFNAVTVISPIEVDIMTDRWAPFKHPPVLRITQIDLTVMEQMKSGVFSMPNFPK